MEQHHEKLEEIEKPPTKRRSSILKLPKPRNPFEDIDVTDTYTDITISKPVRRVSFASSNFVKPFVADPEKNTIWDTTYEEDVNHTNSTQSSQEQTANSCTKFGSTTFYNSTTSMKVSSVLSNVTILSQNDMDLTQGALLSDKENIPILTSIPSKISIIDYAKQLSSNSVVPLFSLPLNQCGVFEDVGNSTKLCSDSMEYTYQNLKTYTVSNECQVDDDVVEMELTELSIREEEEKIAEKKLCTSALEFTCQIPVANVITQGNDNMGFTCQVSSGNLTKASSDMEFTCQIPTKSSIHKGFKMDDQMEISCSNKTFTKSATDMEFTCQIPKIFSVKETAKTEISKLNSTQSADCMEFICQIPPKEIETNRSTDSQIATDNLTKIHDDMEFICQIPGKNSTKTSDMEFTCQIPGQLIETNRPTDSQIPVKNLTRLGRNCDIDVTDTLKNEDDTELSSQTTTNTKSNRTVFSEGIFGKNVTKDETVTDEHSSLLDVQNDVLQTHTKEINQTLRQTKITTNDAKCIENDSQISSENVNMKFNSEISKRNLTEVEDMEVSHQVSSNNLTRTCEVSQKNIAQESNNMETNGNSATLKVANIGNRQTNINEDSAVDKMETSAVTMNSIQEVTNRSKSENNRVSPKSRICQMSFGSDENRIDTNTLLKECKHSIPDIKINEGFEEHKGSGEKQITTPSRILDPTKYSKISSFISSEKWKSPTPKKAQPVKNTPEIRSAKKSPLFHINESDIDLTKEQLKPKIDTSTNTLPNVSMLQQLSPLRTPEPSFHINLTNFSSGVDDTEHLLQATYSKPMSFLLSRIEKSDTQILQTLEDSRNISLPNVANMSSNSEEHTPDTSAFDIQTRNKLANVNDTYVLNGRRHINRVEEADDDEEDTSLGIISDEYLQVIDQDLKMSPRICKRSPKKVELKQYNYTIRRSSDITNLLSDIKSQKEHITNYLKNFKCREMRIPKHFIVAEKSSSDCTESLESTDKVDEEIFPSLEENIRKRQASCHNSWKLETVDDDMYHFSTLFGALILIVQLNVETGRVVKLVTTTNLTEKSKPLARYLIKLFLDKLSNHNIRSAIGEHYDVLSLLDYVQMTMFRLHSFQKEFMTCDNLTMEEDFVVKYKILNLHLVLSCDVLVDVSDIENLNCEQDIKVVTHIGVVNENEIKKFAKNCPKGLDFFGSFQQSIEEYLRVKEKRKGFERNN